MFSHAVICIHYIDTMVYKLLFFVWYKDDEVFLEAQVQNITSSPMVMESVQLEPSAVYTVTDLNFMPADQKKDVSG